jgi:hypothetical protein
VKFFNVYRSILDTLGRETATEDWVVIAETPEQAIQAVIDEQGVIFNSGFPASLRAMEITDRPVLYHDRYND